MKKFENPEIEVKTYETEDVIATSPTQGPGTGDQGTEWN
jgi:hypothetical protein